MSNPFHYGTPAEGDFFTGRADELAALVARMTDGINVVLLSPRRYGKTSLLHAAQARLARRRPAAATMEINVLRATSPSGLAGMLTAGAFRLRGARWHRLRQAVPEFAKRLRVQPTISFDPTGAPRFGFDAGLSSPDAATVISDVYALLAEEAERRPAALVLDEFQAVTRLGDELPAVFKSLADEHPSVSLVLAGSKRHLMEQLVSEASAPLYGMAQRLTLGPLPTAEMVEFLRARAAGAGRAFADGAAEHLVDIAGPVPNDIQHLAYEAFAGGSTLDRDAVEAAMARAVDHEAAIFAEALGRLSPGQARVVVALATGTPTSPYGADFARRVRLANASSVRKALQPLLADEAVVEGPEGLVLADPFFAAWLRRGS